ITGSATVSTLTFSPIQADVAASAVVGLAGQEGAILRKTAIPALVYGLLVGIAGAIMLMF
ncbi:MAG: L-lactate permease, partial [Weissella cibaria]